MSSVAPDALRAEYENLKVALEATKAALAEPPGTRIGNVQDVAQERTDAAEKALLTDEKIGDVRRHQIEIAVWNEVVDILCGGALKTRIVELEAEIRTLEQQYGILFRDVVLPQDAAPSVSPTPRTARRSKSTTQADV